MEGLSMFAKYAFPPNVLQYCGPADAGPIFGVLAKEDPMGKIRSLFSQFYCAVPYLRLIAQSNGIKDEFDKRVVEAYWLGNSLLEKVKAKDFYGHAGDRFKKTMDKKDWQWLISEPMPKAKPFHGFHVFNVYRRADVLRTEDWPLIIQNMDKCRIAWGKIESVGLKDEKNSLAVGMSFVKYAPLEFGGKKLRLGKETIRKVFLTDGEIKKGDDVAIHWEYVCDKITPHQKKNLIFWTKYHLDLANKTI